MQSVTEWKQNILQLYQNKCIICGNKSVTIHEIVPKSKRPKTWMTIENCVPLCGFCHEWAHKYGYKKYKPVLEYCRDKRMEEFGIVKRPNN
jgi:5-methylcytosine-specific restriction endonuclease McrA